MSASPWLPALRFFAFVVLLGTLLRVLGGCVEPSEFGVPVPVAYSVSELDTGGITMPAGLDEELQRMRVWRASTTDFATTCRRFDIVECLAWNRDGDPVAIVAPWAVGDDDQPFADHAGGHVVALRALHDWDVDHAAPWWPQVRYGFDGGVP